jgi:hypothetical protein
MHRAHPEAPALLAVVAAAIHLGAVPPTARAEGDCGGVPCKDEQVPLAVTSEYGALRVGALAQAGFEYRPGAFEGERAGFVIPRARLYLDGHLLSENLTFALSGDALAGLGRSGSPYAPGSETGEVVPGVAAGQGVPFLLDARLGFAIPAAGVEIAVGRFVPSWGLLMGERPTRLGAIHYPLYVHGAAGSPGRFHDLGLEARLRIWGGLSFEAGLFNGAAGGLLDDNDEKDFLAGLLLAPIPGLAIRGSAFFSLPRAVGVAGEDGSPLVGVNDLRIQPILEARFRDFGFDAMLGGAADLVTRGEGDTRDDFLAFGVLGHLGYLAVGDWLQLFVRGEYWDPSDRADGDQLIRITAGPQFLVESIHSQIRVNYIHDRYGSARAMCGGYLGGANCGPPATGEPAPDLPVQARKDADTLLVLFGVDI